MANTYNAVEIAYNKYILKMKYEQLFWTPRAVLLGTQVEISALSWDHAGHVGKWEILTVVLIICEQYVFLTGARYYS